MKTIEGTYRDVTKRYDPMVDLVTGALIAGLLLNVVWRWTL